MSQFDEPRSEDEQQRLNERQALQLLDLDGLRLRLYRGTLDFGQERLATGMRCYGIIAETGLFGRKPRYLTELASLPSSVLFPSFENVSISSDSDQPEFPLAAAFLDLVSEWISCDDIYAFLSGSSGRHPTTIEKLLMLIERWVTPKRLTGDNGPFCQPTIGKLILSGVDTECSLRGFFRYVDLSIDLHNFVGDGDALSRDWFALCMSQWFEDRFVEKTLAILSLFEPTTARRTTAVRELGLLTHRYP